MKYANRFVFYSKTDDNPYIDQIYIQQMRRDMTPKEAERYLDGLWVELQGEVVYCEYVHDKQFRRELYKIKPEHPIIFSWDFNIGEGKPMSMCCAQYIDDTFHFFDEVVISGARTADTIEELEEKGLLNSEWVYTVCGDASGKARSTNSSRSDYDIILKELQNRNLRFTYLVPLANPAVRARHNKLNSYCKNALGQVRLFVYEKCKKLDEGFRLTKLKKGAGVIEDDSKDYQHVTTAASYAVFALTKSADRKPQGTVQL